MRSRWVCCFFLNTFVRDWRFSRDWDISPPGGTLLLCHWGQTRAPYPFVPIFRGKFFRIFSHTSDDCRVSFRSCTDLEKKLCYYHCTRLTCIHNLTQQTPRNRQVWRIICMMCIMYITKQQHFMNNFQDTGACEYRCSLGGRNIGGQPWLTVNAPKGNFGCNLVLRAKDMYTRRSISLRSTNLCCMRCVMWLHACIISSDFNS